MSGKLVRADAKLQHLPEEDLEFLWTLRHPVDAETKPLTLDECAVEVMNRYDVSIALSSLSGFYKWLDLQRRMDRGRRIQAQVIERLGAEGSGVDIDQLKRLGQEIFLAETIGDGDLEGYVAVAKVLAKDTDQDLKRVDQEMDKKRLELLIKKAEFADEVKKAASERSGGVTAEDMAEIERKLKMM